MGADQRYSGLTTDAHEGAPVVVRSASITNVHANLIFPPIITFNACNLESHQRSHADLLQLLHVLRLGVWRFGIVSDPTTAFPP